MAHPRISITTSIEALEEARSRTEEAAYYAWLGRTRYAHPGDHLSDWAEAEREAQKGFPDVPSAPFH